MSQFFDAVRPVIDGLLARQERVTVAIDGHCTAGKTTLAGELGAHYGCTLIHMDDFFLRPEQRTPERFAQPGGNVDYERFRAEVLEPLGAGEAFSYRPFDCGSFTLSDPVAVTPGRLTVIEGTYSHHPAFRRPYDLTVFMGISPKTQHSRVLARPVFLHQSFFSRWIPMEALYFGTFQIKAQADVTLWTP